MTLSQRKRQLEKLIQALRKFVNSTLSARMPFVSIRKPTEYGCLRSHHAAVMSSCPSVTASRNTSPNLDKISTVSPQRQRTQTLPDIHSSQSCSRSRNRKQNRTNTCSTTFHHQLFGRRKGQPGSLVQKAMQRFGFDTSAIRNHDKLTTHAVCLPGLV